MSALPPKADMCSALTNVCFGPKADIGRVLMVARHGPLACNGVSSIAGPLLQEKQQSQSYAIRGYKVPIPSDSGFLPTYNRAIAINHFRLPANKDGETANMTKGIVGFAALIASGFAVAQFIPAAPAATDQSFFQTDTKADDFDALRQRAREALQTLIERQQSNERQQSALRIL